jgi:hypothetical protein
VRAFAQDINVDGAFTRILINLLRAHMQAEGTKPKDTKPAVDVYVVENKKTGCC